MRLHALRSSTFLLLYFALACGAVAAESNPILLGVDMAGAWFIDHDTGIEYWQHEPYYRAINDLGAQFVGIHLYPETAYGDLNSTKTVQKILRMDAGMRAHGLKYQLNNEDANFVEVRQVTPGVNEYDAPGGLHRWDLRMDWLRPVLGGGAFMGVVYDEADHMQIENNRYPYNDENPLPYNTYDVPYLANTRGMTVPQAWAAVTSACTALRTGHYESKVPLYPELLWTGGAHVFARAGWTLSPKLLKESIDPAILADNMGAALQYSDRTQLWICADLHRWFDFPGHSKAALRSALLTAYWIGADAAYVENLDYADNASRITASDPGGLVSWNDTTSYTLTRHGAVVRDFYKNYVPNHPRRVNWRNYQPRVAIIRLPDTDWGRDANNFFRNRLLGNPDTPSDTLSRQWHKLWPILTHDIMGESTSISNTVEYPGYATMPCDLPGFFVPIDSLAVFDHTVTGPVLDSVKCFVVCGHALSAATFSEIKTRVAAGATCIISSYLYSQYAAGRLPGKWLVVDSFSDSRIAATLAPFVGEAGVARYRFKDQIVEFRPTNTLDEITVTVFDRTRIGEYETALLGKGAVPPDSDLNGDGRFDIADLVALIKKFQ